MLSYRHAYHAGNHADVFKHAVLSLILAKLTEKPAPCVYVDTHAGAGLYQLNSTQAQKTGEASGGIERLLSGPMTIRLLDSYLEVVRNLRAQRSQAYPGSPAIAQQLLRPQDKLHLLELHNSEVEILKGNMGRDSRISIHHREGFEALPALAPTFLPRGLALIDPAYEVTGDYAQALASLEKTLARWRTGIYVLWYPLLAKQRDRSDWLKRQLQKLQPANLLMAELWVQNQTQDYGMHGSGLAILNAPWQLELHLEQLLPELSQALAQDSGAGWRVDWLRKPA